ncbi:MAG: leucine-rich repeat domain-containing protein [Tannerellaceae bacterium]|nr:leucine-rich repeat domain-containing protein [Tannerellaceae bacterium]
MAKFKSYAIALLLFAALSAYGQNWEDIQIALYKGETVGYIITGKTVLSPDEPDTLSPHCYVMPANDLVDIISGCRRIANGLYLAHAGENRIAVQYCRYYSETLPPGFIGGRHVTRVRNMVERSNVVYLAMNFDPGKVYVINYDLTGKEGNAGRGILFSINEATDTQSIENLDNLNKYIVTEDYYKAYLEYSGQHRGEMNGTYITKDGARQLTLSGENYVVRNFDKLAGKTTMQEGRYWFNEQTLILCSDTLRSVTQAIRGSSPRERIENVSTIEVMYYTQQGDTLGLIAKGAIKHTPVEYVKSAVAPDDLGEPAPGGSLKQSTSGMVTTDIAWHLDDGVLTVSGKGDVPGDPSWGVVLPNVTSAIISDGITSLGHHAFAMGKLTSLVLGADMSSLKTYALFNCKNLTRIEVRNPVPPSVGAFVFMGVPVKRITLVVPAGAKAAYMKNSAWKKFGEIVEK